MGIAGAHWQYSRTDWCNTPGNGNPGWYTWTDEYDFRYTVIALRGAFHFAEYIAKDNLDVYLRLLAGYDIVRSQFTTSSPCAGYSNGLYTGGSSGIWSIYGGARYRFNDKFGIFGELGYGISYLTLGLSLKM